MSERDQPGDSEIPNAAVRPEVSEVFATTHWSVVLDARDPDSPRSLTALETLCRAYWLPLYAYARGLGKEPSDAEDLTQGFFAALLEKDFLRSAARERGKFRTFLKVAFKRFLANQWDREHAAKRGGFVNKVSMDQELAENRFTVELSHGLQPDVLFDRQWAVTLLERTLNRLHEEYVASGRALLFEQLQPCLARSEGAASYSAIGERLGISEAAVKMAVQRLRARYRELLTAEISQTVASAEDAEQELRHLFAAFQ